MILVTGGTGFSGLSFIVATFQEKEAIRAIYRSEKTTTR